MFIYIDAKSIENPNFQSLQQPKIIKNDSQNFSKLILLIKDVAKFVYSIKSVEGNIN